MTTQYDCSVGISAESTYGTYVAPARHFEFTDETFANMTERLQGEGMRVGMTLARAARRSDGKVIVGGDLTVECASSGQGILWQALLGGSTVTADGTGGSTHIYAPTNTDPMPSYTIQKGVPLMGGGAIQPHTFTGMVCTGGELSSPAGGILTLATSWTGKTYSSATSYVTAVYPSALDLFTFAGGSIWIGGTLTPPSGATPASMTGTLLADIQDLSVKWENNLDDGGYNLGGAAGQRTRKPVLGLRNGTGKVTAEFDTATLRDAYDAQTNLTLLAEYKAGASYGSPTRQSTLQVAIPLLRLEGETPKSNKGDAITQSVDFTILQGTSGNPPLYVVLRTPDAAV